MSLNEAAKAGSLKKAALLDQSFSRFSVRAILAGVYLCIGTVFAGVVGQAVEGLAPGLGSVTFALFFGLGLFAIVILGAELATGNMMYMVYGAMQKHLSWGKAFYVLLITTIFNLVGAIIFAAVMGMSAKLANMDPSHLLVTISEGKLTKSPQGMLVEGMAANFVVNMGIVGAVFAKEIVSKFIVIVPIIGIQTGFVLGGAVYIETVFQWPGIGRMLVTAISTRDILLVQGGVLVVAACYVLINLAADLIQHMLDPRIGA